MVVGEEQSRQLKESLLEKFMSLSDLRVG